MSADTREAEFDYWLHEVGYRYTGDASIYALTIPEMSRLQNGWVAVEQRRNGIDPETEALAAKHGVRVKDTEVNPHRRRQRGSLRESDIRTLREFEGKLNGGA